MTILKRTAKEARWRLQLRRLMEQHGYGQKPLSRAAGLNERTVGQLLAGTDNPGVPGAPPLDPLASFQHCRWRFSTTGVFLPDLLDAGIILPVYSPS